MSKIYIDSKMITLDPFYISLIADLLLEKVNNIFEIDAIGGVSIGSIPVSTMMTYKCLGKKNIQSFVFRKQPKDCGLKKIIEGHIPTLGSNVLIVDDSTSSGNSSLKVADYLKNEGVNIIQILSVFDRNRGAKNIFNKNGYNFDCLISMSEFPELNI